MATQEVYAFDERTARLIVKMLRDHDQLLRNLPRTGYTRQSGRGRHVGLGSLTESLSRGTIGAPTSAAFRAYHGTEGTSSLSLGTLSLTVYDHGHLRTGLTLPPGTLIGVGWTDGKWVLFWWDCDVT